MPTHTDYKKFAVKYNREFKIAGVHKMKKADLINAIEEKLSKSRKEIRDEYKKLKNMVKEKKQVTKKQVVTKKPVVTKKQVVKKKDDKELKLKSNLSKMLYDKMFSYMTGSSKKSYTEDELLFAYKYKDHFLDGDQLSEWKRVYNDKRRVGKTKKKIKAQTKEDEVRPIDKDLKIKKKAQPKKKTVKKTTTPSKIVMTQKPALNTTEIKKKQQASNTIIKAFQEPKIKKDIDFDPNIIETDGDELYYNTDDVSIWLTVQPSSIDIEWFVSRSKIRGFARNQLCQLLNYLNNKSKNKNKLKLNVLAINIDDRFDTLNDLVNLYKKMSFKFKQPIKGDEAAGETTITEFLKFCESFKLGQPKEETKKIIKKEIKKKN